MFGFVLDAIACILVGAIAVHSIILHLRLGRLRSVLLEVGEVLPNFDASVNQMAAMADGFTSKLMAELESVEDRVGAARRLSADLARASRTAEDAAAQLERLLRQHKRVESVRASVLPRAMVEPKGFAERAGLPPAPTTPRARVQEAPQPVDDDDVSAMAYAEFANGAPA